LKRTVVVFVAIDVSTRSTVTFLFFDLESSTVLWEPYPQAMAQATAVHDELVAAAVVENGGDIVDHTGDGVFALFADGCPLHAAVAIERAMGSQHWLLPRHPRLRVGLHSVTDDQAGVAFFRRGANAFGPAVNRAARVMDSAWGGQILATPQAIELNPIPLTSSSRRSVPTMFPASPASKPA
jgi:class 3 adenylate cyclase